MSLHLYSSNRLEILAEAFTGLVSGEPLPPMLPELVVLQSGGMARWLSMQMAERAGICANLDCPFPNQFVDRIFRKVLPSEDFLSTFDRESLQWQLMKALPVLLSEPGFEALAVYLKETSDVKLFRLAGRLADLFDQYTIFRPEMILAWEKGEDDGWQASLWRFLRENDEYLKNVSHRAELRDQCLEALAEGSVAKTLEQGRFSVFGLSSIPVFHLELLTALSDHIDVHFFFMNPCREFWDDIVPGKVIDKLVIDHDNGPVELYYQEGNPLLAASGRQGRELISILHQFGDWEEHDLFYDPLNKENVSALKIVQDDILNLRSSPSVAGHELLPSDRSIQYHSCHSPLRELEVLYDQLLQMFMADPDLEPKDILVMAPDIDFYSPLIEAVFSDRDERFSIPFSIADRKLRNEGGLVRAFQDLLDLRKSRMEISRVLAILEHDVCRRKFVFSSDDLERIEKWLSEVNIRWAVDPQSKVEMGLPGTPDNTWRQGLDRLLLGYAMAGEGRRTFAGILPADNVEGNETEILGRFIDLAEELFSFKSEITKKRDLNGWAELLNAVLVKVFEPDSDQQQEFTLLVELFTSLKEQQSKADFTTDVDFEVIQSFLDKNLSQGGLSTGFMTGAVTFCELLPMRAVPFKCICLLGMNEGDFPRITSAPGFDLIASHPKIGDRSKKSDDRYLFLETILSARSTLYISYIGQSNKDGSQRLPSVLVSELLDYLGPLTGEEGGKGGDLFTTHPMHSFSRKYFLSGDRLVNFSKGDYQAARALSVNEAPAQLITTEFPELPDELRHVDLENLVRFFKNPAEYFCRQRLGMLLSRSDHALDGIECFTVDTLQRYKAGNWLLEQIFSGASVAETSEILRLQGTMPHGSVGKIEISRLEDEVRSLADKVNSLRSGESFRLAEGAVGVGDFTVSGEIDGCRETGNQIICRFAKVNAADQVSGWIRHLFYNCLTNADKGKQTFIVGNDKTVVFDVVADCHDVLFDLLEMYWLGMRKTLLFFPKSSLEFAKYLAKKGEQGALAKAESAWRGSDFTRGEGDDPYYKLCLRDTTPFDDEFVTAAKRFFAPLIDNGSSA